MMRHIFPKNNSLYWVLESKNRCFSSSHIVSKLAKLGKIQDVALQILGQVFLFKL